jgi:hypothetical protein
LRSLAVSAEAGAIRAEIVHEYFRPCARKRECVRTAEPASRACDNDDSSFAYPAHDSLSMIVTLA